MCVWGVCKCGRVGLRWGGVSALVLGEGSGVKHVFSNLDWGGEWGVQHLHSNLYLGRGVGCATLSSQERAHFFFSPASQPRDSAAAPNSSPRSAYATHRPFRPPSASLKKRLKKRIKDEIWEKWGTAYGRNGCGARNSKKRPASLTAAPERPRSVRCPAP